MNGNVKLSKILVSCILIVFLLSTTISMKMEEPDHQANGVSLADSDNVLLSSGRSRGSSTNYTDFTEGNFDNTELDDSGEVCLAWEPPITPYEKDADTLLLCHFDETCDGVDGEAGINITDWLYDWENKRPWQYKKSITVEQVNSAENYECYPVKVILNTTNFDYSKAKPNGDDIRFKDLTTGELLNHWIERWGTSGTSNIWINMPKLMAGESKTIHMFYGNPSAPSASNGDLVFDNFDGFEGPRGMDTGFWKNWNKNHGPKVYNRCENPRIEGSSSLGVRFTTSNDYASLGHRFYDILIDKSIAVWMYDDLSYTSPEINTFVMGGTGHWAKIRTSGSNYKYEYYDGATVSTTISPRSSGWHELRAELSSTNCKLYLDDTLVGTRNLATFNASTIGYQPNWGAAGTQYFDAYYVRSFLTPEPVTSVAMEESAFKWSAGKFGTAIDVTKNFLTYPNFGTTKEKKCVGYWNFDENSGLSVWDSSGESNHGLIEDNYPTNGDGNRPPLRVPGKYGKGLLFDGVDDRVDIPDSASLSITDELTVSAWLKFSDPPVAGDYFSVINKRLGQSNSYSISISDTGQIRLVVDTSSGTGDRGSTLLNDNAWHFITATWDTTEMKVYVDGELDSTGVLKSGSMADTIHNLTFGWEFNLPGDTATYDYYNGTLDEVYIYNYAKSADEVYYDYMRDSNLNLNQGTIEMWVKPNWNGNDGSVHTLFFSGEEWDTDSFYIYKGADNKLKFITSDDQSNNIDYPEVSISDWVMNNWYHVAFTWDSSGNKNIYINGELRDSAINNYMPTNVHSSIYLGGRPGSLVDLLDGAIDELRISKTARESKEFRVFNLAGEYTSSVIDAGDYTDWINITWNMTLEPETALSLQSRTSNDNVNWTKWLDINILEQSRSRVRSNYYGTIITPGPAKYFQWHAIFSTTDVTKSPILEDVTINWNQLPKATNVRVTPANPTIDSDLTVDYDYIDLEDDLEGETSLEWYVDSGVGFVNSGFTGQSLNAARTSSGERWYCKVTPYDGLSFGMPVNSNKINILAGSINNIELLPGNITLTSDEDVTFTAKAYDIENNEITTVFDWNVTSGGTIDVDGKFVPDTVGVHAVSASVGDVTGYAVVMVSPGVIKKVEISPNNPSINIDEQIDFDTIALDGDGNQILNVTSNWSVTGGGTIDPVLGTFTGTSLGDWKVFVNASGILKETTVNVVRGKLSSLTLEPLVKVVTSDDKVQFSVKGYDLKNNELTGTNVNWWVENGTITASGKYTPSAVGDWKIEVSAIGTDITALTTVTVTHGKPIKLLLEPEMVILKIGDSQSFDVNGVDAKGNTWKITENIQWSSSDSELGQITNGTLKALTSGDITVTASVSNVTGITSVYIKLDEMKEEEEQEKLEEAEESQKAAEEQSFMLLALIIILIIIILILVILLGMSRRKKAEKVEEDEGEDLELEEEDTEEPVDVEDEFEDTEAEEVGDWTFADEESPIPEPEEDIQSELDATEAEEFEGLEAEPGIPVTLAEDEEEKLEKPPKKLKKGKGKMPKDKDKNKQKKSGKEALKPKHKKLPGTGNVKLHTMDKTVKCNICYGYVKPSLNIITCVCGKHYHENCATRTGMCPVCETDLKEPVDLRKDE